MADLDPAARALVERAIVASPYGRLLGLVLEACEEDRVALRLPYRDEVTTLGDTVHGGAIASLVDAAATAAFWATPKLAPGDDPAPGARRARRADRRAPGGDGFRAGRPARPLARVPFGPLAFLTGADLFIPTDPPGTVSVEMIPRGGGRSRTLNVPNTPSTEARMVVQFNDFDQARRPPGRR